MIKTVLPAGVSLQTIWRKLASAFVLQVWICPWSVRTIFGMQWFCFVSLVVFDRVLERYYLPVSFDFDGKTCVYLQKIQLWCSEKVTRSQKKNFFDYFMHLSLTYLLQYICNIKVNPGVFHIKCYTWSSASWKLKRSSVLVEEGFSCSKYESPP